MKNVVKMTALSLGLALASGLAAADENIAFINAGYLFQNHPDRQAVANKLDAEFKPMADKLAASKKEIDAKIVASRKKVEEKIAALQKDAPRLRQAEIQKRQEEITKFGSDEEAALNKLMEEQDIQIDYHGKPIVTYVDRGPWSETADYYSASLNEDWGVGENKKRNIMLFLAVKTFYF